MVSTARPERSATAPAPVARLVRPPVPATDDSTVCRCAASGGTDPRG
ncbi:Hypothetical protein I596_2860 [Dokdonella koreensis DS-123]|uniref:Uncharacterized protein n=1 Tax=Dokdonella koreensis DS-123 TaxID=1300342 RepID=A0A160DXY3_9GAMM|nr:Hypothetical protein I596_2860 [Dokdonella koreensis DS-123]